MLFLERMRKSHQQSDKHWSCLKGKCWGNSQAMVWSIWGLFRAHRSIPSELNRYHLFILSIVKTLCSLVDRSNTVTQVSAKQSEPDANGQKRKVYYHQLYECIIAVCSDPPPHPHPLPPTNTHTLVGMGW